MLSCYLAFLRAACDLLCFWLYLGSSGMGNEQLEGDMRVPVPISCFSVEYFGFSFIL